MNFRQLSINRVERVGDLCQDRSPKVGSRNISLQLLLTSALAYGTLLHLILSGLRVLCKQTWIGAILVHTECNIVESTASS